MGISKNDILKSFTLRAGLLFPDGNTITDVLLGVIDDIVYKGGKSKETSGCVVSDSGKMIVRV